MPYEAYRALPATNWSTLKHLRRSPLHYRHALQAPAVDSPALRFGRATHTAILEPHRYALEYAVAPEVDRRTKAGRAAWDAFVAGNSGKTILARDEHDRAWTIGERVRAHPEARSYFARGGEAERVIEWTDTETRIRCKGRIDFLPTGPATILDLKTARTIEYRPFAAQAWRLGYFHQLAFYGLGWEACFGERPALRILAVESEPPHDVVVFEPEAGDLAAIEDEIRSLLVKLAACQKHDHWPGIYTGEQELRRPDWAIPEETIEAPDGPITY